MQIDNKGTPGVGQHISLSPCIANQILSKHIFLGQSLHRKQIASAFLFDEKHFPETAFAEWLQRHETLWPIVLLILNTVNRDLPIILILILLPHNQFLFVLILLVRLNTAERIVGNN